MKMRKGGVPFPPGMIDCATVRAGRSQMDLRKSIAGISVDRLLLVLALCASATAIGLWAWKGESSSQVDPKYLEERYGIADAVEQRVPTPDGAVDATVVPVTLSNGQRAQLIIPRKQSDQALYLRDSSGGIIPVSLSDTSLSRDEFVRSAPVVYEGAPAQQSRPRVRRKRSFEKEALIVAGGAGAGSAIGAVAGGGKGAAVGALSGGIAGLVYDLATRNK